MNSRNVSIDIAKGISIILMTLTHLDFVKKFEYIEFINYNYFIIFKMPLFIIISGFLFKQNNNSIEFTKNKLDGLIKPLITFLILLNIPHIGIRLLSDGINIYSLINIINNFNIIGPFWFIISLFFSIIIFNFLITSYFKFNILKFITILFITILLLSVLNLNDVRFGIINFSTLIYFELYLFIGYKIKRINKYNELFNVKNLYLYILLFSTLIISNYYFGIKLRLLSNQFDPFFLALLYSIIGVFFIFTLSELIKKNNILSNLLIVCGQSSLFILALHMFIGNRVVYPILNNIYYVPYITEFVSLLITLFVCVFSKIIINKIKYLNYFFIPKKMIK